MSHESGIPCTPGCRMRALPPAPLGSLYCPLAASLRHFVPTRPARTPERPPPNLRPLHPRVHRFKTMASSTTMITFAAVFLAVILSMAVAANGQAAGPAPPPSTGAGAPVVPTIVAPAMALFLVFGLGRMLW